MRSGPQLHALVLGPPRSGKTTRLVIPNLLSHPGPAVLTTTKADDVTATIAYRSLLGRCWWWDPTGTTPQPAGTIRLGWSPVTGCEQWDAAVARAHALAEAARPRHGTSAAHDSHWIERAQAVLAPLFHAAALSDGAGIAQVLTWLHRHDLAAPASVLTARGASRPADLLEGLARTDGRELSGILSTADSLLAAYRTDAALAAAATPNFDADAFATSRDTVYLVAPAAGHALHAPLVVALLDQIRAATYRRRPYPSMLFALDELAQIAPLPDLPATIAEGGSQGLLVLACLQDLSQARARWGTAADGFLTLFAHKILLPGIADLATLRAVSALAGDMDVPVRSTSSPVHRFAHMDPSYSWTTQRRPRLPPDEIAQGTPGQAFVVTGTHIGRVYV